MEIKFKLTCILLAALLTNQSSKDIPSIPQIDNTYNVVHTSIYPISTDSRFSTNTPQDFFVQKALKNKNNFGVQQKKQVQTVTNQNQKNFNQSPAMLVPLSTTQAKSSDSQQKSAKREPITASMLTENNKKTIAWAVPKLTPLSSFVVQNGVQRQVNQIFTQKPPVIQYVQQGKLPSKLPSMPKPKYLPKPATSQSQQSWSQPKPQPQLQPEPQIKSQPQLQQSQSQKNNLAKPPAEVNPNLQQRQRERYENHRGNLLWAVVGILVLFIVFVAVRSQKKKKISSLSILQSRLESYKIQQEEQDQESISRSNSSLQDQSGSDDQNLETTAKYYRSQLQI